METILVRLRAEHKEAAARLASSEDDQEEYWLGRCASLAIAIAIVSEEMGKA